MNVQEHILTSILKCRRSDLYLSSVELNPTEQNQFEFMMSRLNSGEPLQYILGNSEFFGLTLKIDERVLIPRPETEILVELVVEKLKGFKNVKILDIGTGSGNIAIALAKNLDGANVTTIDCSKSAIELAKENARTNDVYDKIKFVHADIAEWMEREVTGQEFDLIISNPPYISTAQLKTLPNDVQKEPKIALDGGEDGLKFYRIIIKEAHAFLKSGGLLMMEIGDGQRDDIEKILNDIGEFHKVDFQKDYMGTDRICSARKR